MSDRNVKDDQLEDSIPSVSDDDQKKKNQMFMVGMILLIAASIAILIAAASDNEEKAKDDSLEAKVAEEYEVAKRDLVIPAKQKIKKKEKHNEPLLPPPNLEKPKKKQPLLVRPTSLVNNKPLLIQGNTETQEEKRARKKLAKLWEKRRKASPIIYDKSIELKEEQKRSGGNLPRQTPLDLNAITKSVTDKVGNLSSSSLLGGGDRDKMATRLNSAKTVGVTASYIADKPYTIAEGKMLGCILETAIQSNLPGMTRCILSENIYSYDGKQLLLNKGSRLVGQYEGGIQQGEARIFVIWTRIITPEGIDVALDSPGTGELGRAGHGVQIDSHFFERFGSSALLSIVGGLTSSVNKNDVQFQEVGKSFNKSAEIALKDSIKIKPTGHKNQGERVKVFVARDIDFAPVLKLARKKLFN